MLTYDKSWWGNRVLFRAYGSAFPRSLPYACLAAVFAAILSALLHATGWQLINHAYPVQVFFFVVGFMVIFRNNLSYGRYWEGRTQLQQMTAKLSDAVRASIKWRPPEEEVEEHRWFCDTLVHLISLFHAVALATLRGDYDMENLVVHDSLKAAPPHNARMQAKSNAAGAHSAQHGPAISIADAHSLPRRRSVDSAVGTSEPQTGGSGGIGEEGPPENGGTATRTMQGYTMLSNAWAGSKSVLDYFVLRTDPKRAQHIHRSMKLSVIGGLTQAEGEALGAFTSSGDLGVHGGMLENGSYAPAPAERVQTITSWIHQFLMERVHTGGMLWVYIDLNEALVAYEHCQKLTDTQFPFPWVQAVNIALLLYMLLVPLTVVGFIENVYLATLLTFVAVSTHVTLNEVATDIEDPFHYDPNELPLPQMQYKMNERLLAVLYSDRPLAFTDVGGLTGPGNTVAVPATDDAAASGEDGAAGAGAGTAKAPFGGDAFAGIAQAAFAVAGGDPAEGVPRRRGFLGRPGGGGLAGPGMAGLQSFSAARSRPSSSSAVKWGRHGGTSPGGLAATALQAMARATVSQPLSEIQEGEDADPFLGMPPQFTPPAMPMDPSGAKGDGGRGSVWGL